MVEQNGDILTDNQKELICHYFIAYCTRKRDTHWGIAEQKKFEEQFAILIPDWEKRMGQCDFVEIRKAMSDMKKRIIT